MIYCGNMIIPNINKYSHSHVDYVLNILYFTAGALLVKPKTKRVCREFLLYSFYSLLIN